MEENKQKNTLGIVSLVLGIIAIFFSIIFVISIPLAIASVITGIIALVKKQKKVMPIVGIVLSALSVIISILLIIIVVTLVNNVATKIEESDFEEELQSGLTQLYNGLSEGMTDELNIPNKLEGYSWEASDGSLLELNEDGTYYWYKDADDKTDNYYTGTYTSYLGDSAIEKIDEEFGFNEEAYSQNSAILRTDIYYLELEKEETVINGKTTETIQTTPYALFFYNAGSDQCEGMNLNTQNLASFTKVK